MPIKRLWLLSCGVCYEQCSSYIQINIINNNCFAPRDTRSYTDGFWESWRHLTRHSGLQRCSLWFFFLKTFLFMTLSIWSGKLQTCFKIKFSAVYYSTCWKLRLSVLCCPRQDTRFLFTLVSILGMLSILLAVSCCLRNSASVMSHCSFILFDSIGRAGIH